MKTASGIEARVCDDISARQQKGIAKYGQTVELNPAPIEQWLQHAYEECLDQAIYLKKSISDINELADARKELEQERDTLKRSNAELEQELTTQDAISNETIKDLQRSVLELAAQVERLTSFVCRFRTACVGKISGTHPLWEETNQENLTTTPSDALKEYMKPWVEFVKWRFEHSLDEVEREEARQLLASIGEVNRDEAAAPPQPPRPS